jgi:hypothetical protein
MVAHETENRGLDFEHAMQKPMEMAKEYPVASMLVLFGVGLGVGVLLAQSAPSLSSSSSSSNWWDSSRHWMDDASKNVNAAASRYMDSSYLEKMGQQVCDAIVSSLPKSLGRQLS